MASIRQWHNGYQVRWRDPAGRQRTKTFKRKTDAKQFSSQVEVEMQRGTYVDPQLGKLLFADWAKEWLQTKSTCARRRGHATRATSATT